MILSFIPKNDSVCIRDGSRTHTGLRPTDFLTTMVFTTFTVCGLDYTFTIFFNLGVPRLVSTRSLSGFARYSHFKGFTEFEEFYLNDFSSSTHVLASIVVGK